MLHATPNHVAADFMGTGRDMEGCLMEPSPMYMNLSHSRDCLEDSSAMGDHHSGSSANPVNHAQLPMNEQPFNFAGGVPQVVKQPLAKTNSDGGVVEASATNVGQDVSRMFSSRDGNKYAGQRGQRLHRTIPRHFTTTVPSGGGLAAGIAQENTSGKKDIRDQTLKRNKSEKMTSSSSGNKKPVCQCPIQHVPMTYMGSTTIGSNQLLASNLTGPTKLGSHHHHKSMLNVAKLTQHQQQLALEPAKGYDDEFKLMSNSLRRIKTKVCVAGDGSPTAGFEGSVGVKGGEVKIPTISKQVVLNSDKEHAAAVVASGTAIDGLQSILKHSLPNKSATRTGIAEVDLINPPPFPLEMIDSMAVGQQQNQAASIPPGSDQHPALPPKMSHRGNIQTISKSSSRLTQFKGDAAPGYSQTRPAAHLLRTTTATMNVQQNSNSKSPTSNFPSAAVSHISFSLPKSSGSDNGSGKIVKSQPAATGSKVVTPSAVQSPQTSSQSIQLIRTNGEQQLKQQSGCAKSVGESHFNHFTNNNKPNYQQHQQQPKNSAKANYANKGGEVEKSSPLPVCTTSKNCSNPREHFMPNEASLDDDYLSECENCKSVCGSRYYLEEEGGGPSSPQETMTLQRKMPEANESEEQAYYRTSTTLPTNTKQKNQ